MNNHLFIPPNYNPILNLTRTEKAIKLTKDLFEQQLSAELRLRRVTAPLFVLKGTGINDDLNGIERPVSFPIRFMNETRAEIVHSLAKWKRWNLNKLQIPAGYGLYTDMNAIRPDEDLDNIHSLYVDQWDWELVMTPEDRSLDFLKSKVRRIYEAIRSTEQLLSREYQDYEAILPPDIAFIHTEDLLRKYPGLTPKERENEAAREYGAFFLIGIGGALSHGEAHDGRSPDYDDWTTPTSDNTRGLNGDIVVWNPVREEALELSSMGIRVDRKALEHQLEITREERRKELFYHQRLLEESLPQTIGGGIGQSRLCMFLLRKEHIGEVQAGIWSPEIRQTYADRGIFLL